ncbi:amidohydrolase family protein [Ammoniphilus sp. 3BR4]|uniref:amidohydrolase family protein n=1 Tax=Ammoniphilus sp. 3BR4 TaxID=3158265 RepID=UPI0034669242
MSYAYWITDVRLERGFQYENNAVSGTETEVCHLLIEEGKIAEIVSAKTPLLSDFPKLKANGLLMLPSFEEMHIHIDKTYYSGPWKACTPFINIFTRIEEEQKLLPRLLPTARQRAENMLELLLQSGVTRVRTHCNVDQVIGLKNLEATLQAIETFAGKLSCEVVAFPQHGLLRSQSVQLIREALRSGAQLVGGVDPATVDNNIEKSLQTIMELAVEANADVDVHLHDPGHLGLFTMKRLSELTEEAGWQGRVTVSHAFGLGGVPFEEAAEMAEIFARLGISITSTVPIRVSTPIPPIPLLHEKGVNVYLGTDSITDHWSPFGTGDMLGKACCLAERFRWIDEGSLAQALGFITGGTTPLNEKGNRVWPMVGDEVNAIFIDASCSAEAVARRGKQQAVLYRGKVVSGSLESVEEDMV